MVAHEGNTANYMSDVIYLLMTFRSHIHHPTFLAVEFLFKEASIEHQEAYAKKACNVSYNKHALRGKNAMFDAESMLCEGRMQCLMQKVCFAKEECNV